MSDPSTRIDVDRFNPDEMRTVAPGNPNPETERAQPGDVIGIERDGETTELGDTAEEEDERRRDAVKDGPTRP